MDKASGGENAAPARPEVAGDEFAKRALATFERQAGARSGGSVGIPVAGDAGTPNPPAIGDLREKFLSWFDGLNALLAQMGPAVGQTGGSPLGTAAPIGPVVKALGDPLAALPILTSAVAGAPGEVVRFAMRLANEGGAGPVTFTTTDLIGSNGYRIPAASLSFAPASLPAGGSGAVDFSVNIPGDTPPGQYFGLIQGNGQSDARAAVSVAVK